MNPRLSTLESITRAVVETRLRMFDNNVARTSESLDIGERTLRKWLKDWEIRLPDRRRKQVHA